MAKTPPRSPVVAVSPGCPAGIGPEVAARALADARLPRGTSLVWTGSPGMLVEGARRAGARAARAAGGEVRLGVGRRARTVRCAVADDEDPGLATKPGVPDEGALRSQRDGLLRAIELAHDGAAQAVVTAPVRKAALVVDGASFPGQTELCHRFLAADDEPPLMLFAGGPFLLGLCTVHVPLREVSSSITGALVESRVRRLVDAARALATTSAGRARPRVVVLGVNPHAGEGGLLGDEEVRVVAPALARLLDEGLHVEGPAPADGFFADVARAARAKGRGPRLPDAVLAMAHDQGLAPYKLLAGGLGVNVTWGLRVPRTSPDHGTADALSGKRKASASSMTAALELAARLARGRSR